MNLYIIIETLLAAVLGVVDKQDPVFVALINSTFYGERHQTLVKFASILWQRGWRLTTRDDNYITIVRNGDRHTIACWAYDDNTIYIAWYDRQGELIDIQIV